MNFTEKLAYVYSNKGIVGGTRYLFSRLTGAYKRQEYMDALYFFINNGIDIRTFPKARGNLRLLQECDTELLHIFHQACSKHGLTYWLDFGTLLGAVRHGGFIPWDDDLDVAMPREDYNRALEIFPEELKKLGIDVYEFSFNPMASMGFTFRHTETGVWLDIFPVDQCFYDRPLDEVREDLNRKVYRYRKFYGRKKKKLSVEQLAEKKNEWINEPQSRTEQRNIGILYHEPEFQDAVQVYHEASEVYPLGMCRFENYEFCVPGDCDAYLKREYGADYMSFPRSGVEHHYGKDGKLCDWAVHHNIRLEDILVKLKEIASTYECM